MEAENRISIFDDLQPPVKRRALIPKWMWVCCWIFAIVGPLGAVAAVVSLILNIKADVSIYGLDADYARTLPGIIALIVFSVKGAAAIGLLKEKDWAVKVAIIDGALGILLCIYTMIVQPWVIRGEHSISFQFRLEILLLVPFLLRMLNIRSEWEEKKYFETPNNE